VATVVNCGPSSPVCDGDKYITTWFRHEFAVPEGMAAEAQSLLVELVRDDGAAVYLNGVEIMRSNLPGVLGDNAVGPNTGASAAMDFDNETTFFPATVDLAAPPFRGILRDGKNVLAVEVHQSNTLSSDISFNLRLSAMLSRVTGVLGNDVEPDLQAMTASVVTLPSTARCARRRSSTRRRPTYVGGDSFTYQAVTARLRRPPR
jgi:hypothetical protein